MTLVDEFPGLVTMLMQEARVFSLIFPRKFAGFQSGAIYHIEQVAGVRTSCAPKGTYIIQK